MKPIYGIRGVFIGAVCAGVVSLAVVRLPSTKTIIGCANPAAVVKTVVDVGGAVGCVLSHETEPPAQIVGECKDFGELTVGDVDKILEQHRAAVARERAMGMLPACGGDGGK